MAEISSNVRPHYIISGIQAEVLFSAPGCISFAPQNHGVWNPEARRVEIWGDPACKWQGTSEADAAEFAAAVVEQKNAADGGFWTVCSGYESLEDMARICGHVWGTPVKVEQIGSVKDLWEKAQVCRAQSHPTSL
jgi:hypothetical protein